MELKKNKKYELEPKRPMFFGIGMIISISLALVAFEWKSEVDPIIYPQPEDEVDWYVMDEIEITRQEVPDIPKPKMEKKVITPDVIIKEVEDIIEDMQEDPKIDIEETVDDIIESIPVAPEIPDEPFIRVEQMPEFPGGEKALLTFISKNLKYPRQAQQMGIQGRVHVQFVIDKDGSVTNIKLVRGIGAGCDEEAMRVLGMLPKFSPGKQRGKPVRVQMQLPVFFKLK